MRIAIASSCLDSSMLTSSIIGVEINYNCSLNLVISLEHILCFQFLLEYYIFEKVIIANTIISDWGWSIKVSHKCSANYNLDAFFSWAITKNFLVLW